MLLLLKQMKGKHNILNVDESETALHRCSYKKVFWKYAEIYRRTPKPKCEFKKLQINFIEITLQNGCSPVNWLHIFETPFYKNTSGGLLTMNTQKKLSNKIIKY